MEQTSKAAALPPTYFSRMRSRLLRGALLILLAFLAGRAALMGELFPAAIAITAYMVRRNTLYVYLVIPAGAGIYSCILRGCDSWGEMITLCACAALMVALRRMKLRTWHVAAMTAATGIICVSAYRLATNTVYRTGVEELVLEGALLFSCVILFGKFYETLEGSGSGDNISAAAFAFVCALAVCGAGLNFLLWPAILFITLGMLSYEELGGAVTSVVTAGIFAFMLGETQWGLMLSLIIASCVSHSLKRLGTFAVASAFAAVCWLLGFVDSGIVLGTDEYSFLLAVAAFAAVNWRFGERLRSVFDIFAGKRGEADAVQSSGSEKPLVSAATEMRELAELYDTYLDSRSMLATQFSITRQILDETGRRMQGRDKLRERLMPEKFDADIAVSQCAAAGAINGDCCGWQDLDDGRCAMVISDGMGKGKKAATESLMVTRTILGLLRAGADTEFTLKMINTIMMMKEDEDSFATVDLIVFDKRTGRAKFYKIGAAPTLIRRRNNVEEVRLSAVPLGIVNGLKIRYVEVPMKKGDRIVMMSDGVSDGGSGEFLPELKETVRDIKSGEPQVMSDLILNRASDSYLGKERDDMTVMVAKLV